MYVDEFCGVSTVLVAGISGFVGTQANSTGGYRQSGREHINSNRSSAGYVWNRFFVPLA